MAGFYSTPALALLDNLRNIYRDINNDFVLIFLHFYAIIWGTLLNKDLYAPLTYRWKAPN